MSELLAAIASLMKAVASMYQIKIPRFCRPIISARQLFQSEYVSRYAHNLRALLSKTRSRLCIEVDLRPECSSLPRDMDVRRITGRSVMRCVASTAMLMMLVTWAAAQGTKPQAAPSTKLQNVDLCNGVDSTSAEAQIIGCTVLIESGLENSQTLVIAYNNRGTTYAIKGKYELAIQDFGESIKLNPNWAKTFNNRGVAYKKKGDDERAIKDFEAAININPDYASAFANRAQLYGKKGDYGRALKDFDEAIRLHPTLDDLWNGRCWTRTMTGELQAALTDCNEALRLKPNVTASLDTRGLTYLKLGQWELAIADFNSALRLDPKLPSSLYGRGYAKLKRGDLAGGNADIEAAKTTEQNIVGEFARYGLN